MNNKKSTAWKKSYTWVLIANVIYVLVFYLIMEYFD